MDNKAQKNKVRPEILNPKAGIYTELEGRDNLLVSFGGGQGGLGVPVFEFFNSIAHLDCDKIFVRDLRQEYYQRGVDGQIDNADKLAKFFQDTVKKGNYKRVLCIGNSMGGYAAILFGSLMNADRVLSFAPQTFIDMKTKIRYWDWRALGGHLRINLDPKKNKNYFDLAKHLNRLPEYKTKITIWYDINYKIDHIHIDRMKDCRNVELIIMQEGGHDVVKIIKKRGELKQLIEDAILGDY